MSAQYSSVSNTYNGMTPSNTPISFNMGVSNVPVAQPRNYESLTHNNTNTGTGHHLVKNGYSSNCTQFEARSCLSKQHGENSIEQYDLFQSLTPPVEIIGISEDSVEDHRRFKEELSLPFPLLSDPERDVAKAYGVPLFLGRFPGKSSFLVGPDRKIHYCYDWLFRPRKHVAKILNTLSRLSGAD